MPNTQSDIELVKQRLQVSVVVGDFIRLTKKGSHMYGLCPFHKEKTPSFSVRDDKGFFYCFGCGVKGDVFTFIMKVKHISFYEALKFCASKIGLALKSQSVQSKTATLEISVLDVAKQCFVLQLESNLEVQKYLLSRFHDKNLLSKFDVGYAGDFKHLNTFLEQKKLNIKALHDYGLVTEEGKFLFRNRIIFPIKDPKGNVLGFGGRKMPGGIGPKYLNSSESAVFQKRKVLYGLDVALPQIKDTRSVVVVEGYTDVISLHQYGFCNAVASLGTAVTESQVTLLLYHASQVTFCFDGDSSGKAAAARVIRVVLPVVKVAHDIRFASLADSSDPCEFLQREGREGFEAVLSSAPMLSEFIWQVESGGVVPSVPEYQAKLEKSLMAYVDLIKDPDLRKYYRLYFLRKIRTYRYQNWSNASIKYLPDIRLDHEFLIIRIVIDFPSILTQTGVQEQFMDFDMEECSELQDLVLSFIGEEDFDLNNLNVEIEKAGLMPILNKARVYTKNYQIADFDGAFALWQRILTVSEIHALEKEYSELVYRSMEDESELKRAAAILDTILHLKSKIRSYSFAI